MRIFVVGGAVRDRLLGRPVKDVDLLVVGSTPEEFKLNFPEAKQVGKDFPVYLVNGEEYAMARTERSLGDSHTEFKTCTSGITLEQDLLRRDLTINSLAMCPETNMIVGDQQGFMDIASLTLRNTSDAFAEDPLRILRVARFAASIPGSHVDPETNELMRSMAHRLPALPEERVFGELEKALLAPDPHRFFEVLADCDCLEFWFKEIHNLIGVPAGPDVGKHKGERDTFHHTMRVISKIPSDPCLRFSGLCHDLGKALSPTPPSHIGHDVAGIPLVKALCVRLRVPNKYTKAALLFTEQHLRMHRLLEMGAGKAVKLIMTAHKMFPGGLQGFLSCSVGDGMTEEEVAEIVSRSEEVISARIPEKYRDRGKACRDILHQHQCKLWRNTK